MSIPVDDIQCNQIYLRQINKTDVQAIFKIYSDNKVTKYLDDPAMERLVHAEYFIDKVMLGYLNGHLLEWAIVEKNKNSLIGTIHYKEWDYKHGHAEIGFALSREWWGKGIMKELLSPFLQFGFNELKLNRIQANIHTSNKTCTKLFENFGFKIEGILRERFCLNNTPQDVMVVSLLKNESKLLI